MGKDTNISWCDHTFNPWIGCSKISPGCANCYAENLMDKRYGRVRWGDGNERSRTSAANWRQPLLWDKQARENKYQARVFCASLADVWDNQVPIGWLIELLSLIGRTPNLDWLLLSKRPQNALNRLLQASEESIITDIDWVSLWIDGDAPKNVWLGTSVEDQKRADERIPLLLEIPAKVHFLSCEPLLGPVSLLYQYGAVYSMPPIDWVIVGGESGNLRRPMNPDWAREIRDICVESKTPFFFKQHGGSDKAKGGDLLDGLRWHEFPEVKR